MDTAFVSQDKRVAGIFENQSDAQKAINHLRDEALAVKQAAMLSPSDSNALAKLEANDSNLERGLLTVHLGYGALGLLIGAILTFLAVEFGPQFTAVNPVFTGIAFVSLGVYIGLFLSSWVSLRPERDTLNMAVTEALKSGNWLVVVTLKEGTDKASVTSLFANYKPIEVL